MDWEYRKRVVPPAVQQILEVDVELTRRFVKYANKYLPLRSLRIHYKMLEVSCHGVPWFAFWIAFTWLFNNKSLIQMQVNMLFGLIIDVIFVALLKAYVRRRRPVENTDDILGQIGPDKFSFPSGHASRAVFVSLFFMNLYPVSKIFWPPLLAWTVSVSLSRLLLYRHHIMDVFGGVILGIFVTTLMSVLWVSEETAIWIMSSITDERLDGGSYHV